MQDNPNDKALRDELLRVAKYALEWIDAVPKDLPLPTMPGFDRDWADRIIENAEQHHSPRGTQEPNRSAEVDVRQLAQESYTKYCQSYKGDFMAWHFWKRAYDCAWSDFALPFQQQIEALEKENKANRLFLKDWSYKHEVLEQQIEELKAEVEMWKKSQQKYHNKNMELRERFKLDEGTIGETYTPSNVSVDVEALKQEFYSDWIKGKFYSGSNLTSTFYNDKTNVWNFFLPHLTTKPMVTDEIENEIISRLYNFFIDHGYQEESAHGTSITVWMIFSPYLNLKKLSPQSLRPSEPVSSEAGWIAISEKREIEAGMYVCQCREGSTILSEHDGTDFMYDLECEEGSNITGIGSYDRIEYYQRINFPPPPQQLTTNQLKDK